MRKFINRLESKLNQFIKPLLSQIGYTFRRNLSPKSFNRPALQKTQLSARFRVRAPSLRWMGAHVSHMWDCSQANTDQIDGQNPSKTSRWNWLAKAEGQDQ